MSFTDAGSTPAVSTLRKKPRLHSGVFSWENNAWIFGICSFLDLVLPVTFQEGIFVLNACQKFKKLGQTVLLVITILLVEMCIPHVKQSGEWMVMLQSGDIKELSAVEYMP